MLAKISVRLGMLAAAALSAVAHTSPALRHGHSLSADAGLWPVYRTVFRSAKYVDLTYAFAPGQPRGAGLADIIVGPARADATIPGLIAKGDPISYSGQGVGITAYGFGSDQIGTQLDPPAHWNARGATISDLPPTFALRPLAVIDVTAKVAVNPGYVVTPADVTAWERRHGRIPEGGVVMIRTGWSRYWHDPKRFAGSPHPGIGIPALQFLHFSRHILFHGHETLDTDDTPDFAAEAWLLRHNFAQAENVANLDKLPEAGALISIGFAKPEGGTGGLARFVAIVPSRWKYGVTIDDSPGAPLPEQARPLVRGADGVLRPTGG